MAFDADARLAEWRKSLLDTTKRNRLIKFAAGRVGGLYLLHPSPVELWGRLIRDGATLTFSWKRSILGLSPEKLDAESLASDYDPVRGTIAPDPAELDRALTEEALKSPHLTSRDVLTDFPDRLLAARLTRLYLTAKEAGTPPYPGAAAADTAVAPFTPRERDGRQSPVAMSQLQNESCRASDRIGSTGSLRTTG